MVAPILRLIESAGLPYLLSLPPAPAATVALRPVLCFLHGYDEGAPMPIEQGVTRHGPLAPSSFPQATVEFIIVAPQLPTRGDLWHRYATDVAGIVRQVQTEHGGDPERTYLTGFSYGGSGVFDLAVEQRELWTALWPVDPTRVPEESPDCPIWLSSGEISRRYAQAFTKRLRLQAAPGVAADPTSSAEPGTRVYVDQNQDHVGTARLAYRDERIYQWLLAQTR